MGASGAVVSSTIVSDDGVPGSPPSMKRTYTVFGAVAARERVDPRGLVGLRGRPGRAVVGELHLRPGGPGASSSRVTWVCVVYAAPFAMLIEPSGPAPPPDVATTISQSCAGVRGRIAAVVGGGVDDPCRCPRWRRCASASPRRRSTWRAVAEVPVDARDRAVRVGRPMAANVDVESGCRLQVGQPTVGGVFAAPSAPW